MDPKSTSHDRRPIPPEDVDLLLDYLLGPDEVFTEKFMGLVGAPNKEAFLYKVLVYRLALAIVCVVSREGEDSRFTVVRRSLEEKAVFPLWRDVEGSRPLFAAAMREIAMLGSSETMHLLSWAREWFAGIGVELTNFVRAGMLVIIWQQQLYYTLKLLDNIAGVY